MNATAHAAHAEKDRETSMMLLLEIRRQRSMRDIIADSYWIHRNWRAVARDLSVCDNTLRSWRRRAAVSDEYINEYIARRVAASAA